MGNWGDSWRGLAVSQRSWEIRAGRGRKGCADTGRSGRVGRRMAGARGKTVSGAGEAFRLSRADRKLIRMSSNILATSLLEMDIVYLSRRNLGLDFFFSP